MIVLYTTKTCPKCSIIKTKLDSKGVTYSTVDNPEILTDKGYNLLPVLEVDNKVITSMIEINEFINQL